MASDITIGVKITRALKTWAKRLGTVLAIALISVGCSELLVRVVVPQKPVWMDIYVRHPRLPFHALRPNATYAVDTRETKWSVLIDAHGHRVLAAQDAPSGDRPLAVWLGDSFTFGHGIDYPLAFVSLVEARGKYRSLNAGVPSYGPVQYRMVLEDELAQGIKPARVIVMSYLGNDIDDCVTNKDLPVVDGAVDPVGGIRSWLLRKSHFYRLAQNHYRAFRARNTHVTPLEATMSHPDGWSDPKVVEALRIYREELGRIKTVCDGQSIPLLVGLIPSRALVAQLTGSPFPESAGADYSSIPKKVSGLLDGLGIRSIDLTDVLRSHPLAETYFDGDGHFTALGNKLAAEELAKAIP